MPFAGLNHWLRSRNLRKSIVVASVALWQVCVARKARLNHAKTESWCIGRQIVLRRHRPHADGNGQLLMSTCTQSFLLRSVSANQLHLPCATLLIQSKYWAPLSSYMYCAKARTIFSGFCLKNTVVAVPISWLLKCIVSSRDNGHCRFIRFSLCAHDESMFSRSHF